MGLKADDDFVAVDKWAAHAAPLGVFK
jgi:hypothetical protein